MVMIKGIKNLIKKWKNDKFNYFYCIYIVYFFINYEIICNLINIVNLFLLEYIYINILSIN